MRGSSDAVERDLTFGSLKLKHPEVIAVVECILPSDRFDELAEQDLRILELRFDSFSEPWSDVVAFAQSMRSRFAILGTCRENEENRNLLKQRYADFVPVVDCVDIEIGTERALRSELIRITKDSSRQLMLSHHDFEKTPPDAELDRTIDDALLLRADFVKLALAAPSRQDAARLMFLLERRRDAHLSAFSMGSAGAVTRIAGGLFGSIFTYGYMDHPNAPGQLSARELLALRKKFYS